MSRPKYAAAVQLHEPAAGRAVLLHQLMRPWGFMQTDEDCLEIYSDDVAQIQLAVTGVVHALRKNGFQVRRYLIHKALIDSDTADQLGLLEEAR